jgi:hypothetical protein
MQFVSLFVEILRTRPNLVLWFAVLAQAFVWTLVPSAFYSAPPGELADVLAIGHEFPLSAGIGPPLAYWLAEIAFRAAGNSIVGVYLLAQICVVVTYWAVFALGRAILGDRHAVLAILLMVGISTLTVPTPDFGPAIIAMPLWALALLHLWRAVGESQHTYWYFLAIDLALLLVSSYLGLVLSALLVAFVVTNARCRRRLTRIEPVIGISLVGAAMLPSLVWIDQASAHYAANLAQLTHVDALDRNLIAWLRLATAVVVSHAGLGILVAIASNLTRARRPEAAVIERSPANPFAHTFVYYFALVPAIAVTALAVLIGYSGTVAFGPLVVLSGLAVVMAGGDCILLHHQRVVTGAWLGLLLVPPAFAALAVLIVPLTLGIDLKIAQPANDMGRFFAESFERRTGRPLEIVSGEQRLAAIVALGAPTRPSVLMHGDQPRAATPTRGDLAEKGGIILWPATDSAGTPPPPIKEQFPDLVPEVPQAFERGWGGMLASLRVGWAMIRPAQRQ